MSLELLSALSALVAVVGAIASFGGAWAAIKVHLQYLRRDLERVTWSARDAHDRLDQVKAPPARHHAGRLAR